MEELLPYILIALGLIGGGYYLLHLFGGAKKVFFKKGKAKPKANAQPKVAISKVEEKKEPIKTQVEVKKEEIEIIEPRINNNQNLADDILDLYYKEKKPEIQAGNNAKNANITAKADTIVEAISIVPIIFW